MSNKKCKNCTDEQLCKKDKFSWIFIIIGFISTVSIRVVTLLMNIGEVWGLAAWYIGVVGFVIFFLYKYHVFSVRAKTIENRKLLEKLSNPQEMKEEDYKTVSLMLCKIRSHTERVNFLFIFVVSFIALVLAIYFDFIA